jgi:hypothetical protein
MMLMIYLRIRKVMKAAADPIAIGTTSQGCAAAMIATTTIAMPLVVGNQRPSTAAVIRADATAWVNQPSPSCAQAWTLALWMQQ